MPLNADGSTEEATDAKGGCYPCTRAGWCDQEFRATPGTVMVFVALAASTVAFILALMDAYFEQTFTTLVQWRNWYMVYWVLALVMLIVTAFLAGFQVPYARSRKPNRTLYEPLAATFALIMFGNIIAYAGYQSILNSFDSVQISVFDSRSTGATLALVNGSGVIMYLIKTVAQVFAASFNLLGIAMSIKAIRVSFGPDVTVEEIAKILTKEQMASIEASRTTNAMRRNQGRMQTYP